MTARRQTGLSLIELMISLTLGLLVLSGVLMVFVNTSASRNEVERTSRQIENGRFAVELVSTDLRLAGFYGELDVSSVTPPAAVPANPCSLAAADWNAWIPVHLQGFDNAGFVSADCPFDGLKAGTDVLVVRRARACAAGVAGCDAAINDEAYVQAGLCGTVTTTHRLGVRGVQAFDLEKKDCATAADLRQYLVHVYYVSTNNGAGVNVPTLKRFELKLGEFVSTPLVEGIEEFQVEYGLDTDGDGVPDSYVANPSNFPKGACAGACPLNNWMNVVTARVHLLARNLETSPGFTDAKTYALGNDIDGAPVTVTPGGAYRRHVYSSLVRVANAAGRRDKP
ncbi:MAG TPA: PilW family protein [Burkholderiales bacterium]|nr:PilW family protein [Burkholderiales bacterium]